MAITIPERPEKFRSKPTHSRLLFDTISRAFSSIGVRRHRVRPRDFSRSGLLTPELLTILLLYMVADGSRRGYRHLMRAFWDDAEAHGLPLPCVDPVSAPSFCEARQKLGPELLRELLYEIAWPEPGGSELGNRRWRGRRVLAVDGTKINLQRAPELEQAFGVPEHSYNPQALLSVMVDVCRRVPMDMQVSSFATSERDHLEVMLASLEPGDILVLDRGYFSHRLLQQLTRMGVDYLIRLPSGGFLGVDAFRASGKLEQVVSVTLPTGCDSDWQPIRTRLVQIEGRDGELAFYATSLRREEVSRAGIAELYHLRWEAEEFYKLLKSSYCGQAQYRSKSAHGVVQEMEAAVLYLAIARLCVSVAAAKVVQEDQFPSQKGGVLTLAIFLTRIFLEPNQERAREVLEQALKRIASIRDKRRPGRSFPRRSFRPRARWVPTGRRGA